MGEEGSNGQFSTRLWAARRGSTFVSIPSPLVEHTELAWTRVSVSHLGGGRDAETDGPSQGPRTSSCAIHGGSHRLAALWQCGLLAKQGSHWAEPMLRLARTYASQAGETVVVDGGRHRWQNERACPMKAHARPDLEQEAGHATSRARKVLAGKRSEGSFRLACRGECDREGLSRATGDGFDPTPARAEFNEWESATAILGLMCGKRAQTRAPL